MKRILSLIVALAISLLSLVLFQPPADATYGSGGDEPGGCTPTAAHTEYTDYRTESPGEGWYPVDTKTETVTEAYDETVVVKEAYDEVVKEAYDEQVFDHWQRYSWTGGPHTEDSPPAFPSADWQPNVQGDPHGIGHAGAYYRSNGNSGNGDWFYLEAVTKTVHHEAEVIHHEAETKVVHHEAVTRVLTQYAKDFPAVECPPEETKTVTPLATGTPDDCDADPFGTITVTEVEGVTGYTLQDGSPIVGTIPANGTNTVTAHLAEGYVLAEGAVDHWEFTSNPATDCPGPPEEPSCENTPDLCPIPEQPEGDTDTSCLNGDLVLNGTEYIFDDETSTWEPVTYTDYVLVENADECTEVVVPPENPQPPTDKPEKPQPPVGHPQAGPPAQRLAPPVTEQVLPNTGGPSWLIALIGIGLVGVGVLGVTYSQRRNKASD